MPYYSVLIEGRDFPAHLSHDGTSEMGFFALRFVEAAEPDEAELAAVEMIRTELRDAVGKTSSSAVTPMMHLDEMKEIDAIPDDQANAGFTWYRMDAEE
ncbi:hypothetical protein [Qipengyuania aquimaris]|uniref:hypothetical protein n=1 Tax=Qipengyuania aquimaris TaxID=255984 RepID=UPI001FD58EAE|nr:hypothetical protein [Qipengyuania aquimaris]UOR16657.1 hypothetical protein LCM05_06310 [Qipengyuania aquimaris]